MELFKSVFFTCHQENSTVTTQRISKQAQLLLGPSKSGRSSLLFELAFLYADQGKSVLFITPKVINTLPLLLAEREQPSVETLDKIEIVYLERKNELLEFTASVHIKYKEPIDVFIVDDIDHYYREEPKRSQLAAQAKVFAFVLDAVAFMNRLG